MQIQRKAAMPVATEVNADEGVVVAIVSVTGTVDDVKDIIEPGAYAKTLVARKPKVVHSHDWNTPIGRVDEIKELLPGDPHLPKTQPNGDPWPAEAGALVVKSKFNLETQRGRESFSDVKFYGSDGAWSIGYNVPVGGATVEAKTGIRRIKQLDLYEVSPVLHGAHSMAGTQFVKALPGSPNAPAATDPSADAPPPAETGVQLVCDLCAGTEPIPGTHICARCDGPMSPEGDASPDSASTADAEGVIPDPTTTDIPLAEQKALGHESLDHSPKKNWVEESGQLPAYIQHIAKDLHEERGMTLSHAIAVAISKVKKWAAGGDNVKADTRAKAAAAVAEWEALKAKNAARSAAKKSAFIGTETKWFRGITGTVEEQLDAIRSAVRDSLMPPRPPTTDMVMNEAAPYTYVDVIGTYDGYAIASVSHDGGDDDIYRVPYTVSADGDIVIGIATEVDIQTVVVPKQSEPTEIVISLTDPMDTAEKARRVCETKAGRVLSSSNAAALRAAVEQLINVLKQAGVDVADETEPAPAATKTAEITEREIFELEALKLAV